MYFAPKSFLIKGRTVDKKEEITFNCHHYIVPITLTCLHNSEDDGTDIHRISKRFFST